MLIRIILFCIFSISTYAIDLQGCNRLYQQHSYSSYIDKCSIYSQSDINTAMNLADIYSNGTDNVIANSQNRILHLKDAASLGSIEAQSMLCIGYFDGSIGYINYEQSFWWCSKFATRKNIQPKMILAYEYKNGLGTSKNLEQAKKIFLSLAQSGDSEAQFELAEMLLSQNDKQNGYYWLRLSYQNSNQNSSLKVRQLIDSDDCDSTLLYFDKHISYKKAFSKCNHETIITNSVSNSYIGDVFDNKSVPEFDSSSPSDASSLFKLMMLGQ